MSDSDQDVQYVERRTGWSSFWRWVGTIVVVLIIGMIVIYVANTFLLGQQMNVQNANSEQPDAQIDLSISSDDGGAQSDSGDASASDTGN